MQIYLGGHLNFYETQKRSRFQMTLNRERSLLEVCRMIGIPVGEIALVVLNGKIVEVGDAEVKDEDRVELFSPIGGG